MSRKAVLRLHRIVCCAPAALSPKLQCPPCIQAVASYQQPPAALNQPLLGSRSFAASACQPQSAQATASTELLNQTSTTTNRLETAEEQDVPEEQYSHSGRITGPYIVKPKAVFAVVELGPTQFKVTPDDLVYSEKLKGVDVGDQVSLNRVLLLGNTATTVIGRPCIPGATVTAVVEEQFLNGKVLIFKKRRRKNSRRLNGHRQELTGLRITDVHGLDAAV